MLAAEHPVCLHSQLPRSTISASQRYLTADVRQKYRFTGSWHTTPERHDSCHRALREIHAGLNSRCRPPEHDFAGDRWHGFRDRNDICHSKLTEANRAMKAECRRLEFQAAEPQRLRFHAILDHGKYSANRAMQLIAGRHHFRAEATLIRRSGTGPARSSAGRVPSLPTFAIDPYRQPAIPDGGRSAQKKQFSASNMAPVVANSGKMQCAS